MYSFVFIPFTSLVNGLPVPVKVKPTSRGFATTSEFFASTTENTSIPSFTGLHVQVAWTLANPTSRDMNTSIKPGSFHSSTTSPSESKNPSNRAH